MTWKERFLRFLKEENVYGEWVYNIRIQHPQTDLDFWNMNFKSIFSEDKKCAGGIITAFCWSDTIQGYNFWSKIDDEWNTKCGYWKQLL